MADDPNPFLKSSGFVHNPEQFQLMITEISGKNEEERKKEFDEMYERVCLPLKNKDVI